MNQARHRLATFDGVRLGALASVALLGALVAGCAGSSSSASKPQGGSATSKVWHPSAPDTAGPVVAVVAGRKVTRHEIDSLILTAPLNIQSNLREFEGYRDVVDRVVTQEALVSAARMSGVEEDPGYKADLARITRELMGRKYWELKVKSLPEIPDSAVRAYYDSHPEEFTLNARSRIRHIAVATQKKAAQVRASLEKGALWDETCRKQSLDAATKENGGLLGYIPPETDLIPGIGKSPAIAAAAFSLPIGDVSKPLKGPKNWHLIRVESREDKTVRPYEESRANIRSTLDAERRDAYGKSFVDSVKATANAVIFDDSIRVALKPAKTAVDLFKEAQAAATPVLRIKLYREVVKEFPQDSIAVQAQFMVGFTFAEELNDYEVARAEFERFIQDHPNTELAESARWMLDNMEKPPPPLEGEPSDGDAPRGGTDSIDGRDPGSYGDAVPEGAPR